MTSKRRLRRRECTGKQRFESEAAAREKMAWLDKVCKLRPGSHPYPCRFGNHFHIGREGRDGLYGPLRQRRQRIKSWQWNMGV